MSRPVAMSDAERESEHGREYACPLCAGAIPLGHASGTGCAWCDAASAA